MAQGTGKSLPAGTCLEGNLKTDENGETTMKGVFASGDVVTGARTVVEAVAQSKRIADDMDRYMKEHAKK